MHERWIITGASGQLGGHLVRALEQESPAPALLALVGRSETGATGPSARYIDLADLDALRRAVAEFRPTHVIHTGAMTAVADCFTAPARAQLVNVQATAALADACVDAGARLVFTSTDMVFDGQSAPYGEDSPPSPLSVYGRTKVAAERIVRHSPGGLSVRIPLLYGLPRGGRRTTFAQQVAALREGRELKLFVDEFRTPLALTDAARALLLLARSARTGLIHVAGPERLSRYELVARTAVVLGIAHPRLVPISRLDIASPEPRPMDLSLDASRFAGEFPGFTPRAITRETVGSDA
ncbi:MAG: SDR family oxidoreductase [Phycisphaerae bacterium]|jgi:dTDP-4-dehydrorhamnose reductase